MRFISVRRGKRLIEFVLWICDWRDDIKSGLAETVRADRNEQRGNRLLARVEITQASLNQLLPRQCTVAHALSIPFTP